MKSRFSLKVIFRKKNIEFLKKLFYYKTGDSLKLISEIKIRYGILSRKMYVNISYLDLKNVDDIKNKGLLEISIKKIVEKFNSKILI